jgi:enoyl-CoA hydratase/carnithine racemase
VTETTPATGTTPAGETITGSDGTVWATITDGVVDLRLNRPATLNSVTSGMFADLLEVGLIVRGRPGIRAVVLSGEGRAFCAGLDMAAFDAMASGTDWRDPTTVRRTLLDESDPLQPLNRGQRAAGVWAGLPVPVIAAVHGPAYGAGLQLAVQADIRIVAPDAALCVAEVRWGLIPDMGATQLLPRLVGTDVALELTCTGRVVSGEEAARIGLATRVAEHPREEALELARRIAGLSPDAVQTAKSLVNSSWERPYADGLAAESAAMLRLARSPNQREAVRARQQKRPPLFTDPPPTHAPFTPSSANQERTTHA